MQVVNQTNYSTLAVREGLIMAEMWPLFLCTHHPLVLFRAFYADPGPAPLNKMLIYYRGREETELTWLGQMRLPNGAGLLLDANLL